MNLMPLGPWWTMTHLWRIYIRMQKLCMTSKKCNRIDYSAVVSPAILIHVCNPGFRLQLYFKVSTLESYILKVTVAVERHVVTSKLEYF